MGQVRQKRFHLRRAHLGRVPQPVKADEGLYPVDVGLLGRLAVVRQPQAFAQLIRHRVARSGARPDRAWVAGICEGPQRVAQLASWVRPRRPAALGEVVVGVPLLPEI